MNIYTLFGVGILSICLPMFLPDVSGPALYDVLHDRCPPLPVYLPDILLALTSLYVIWLDEFSGLQVEKVVACLAIRAFTCSATRLPTPVPKEPWRSQHDLMFSGHTVCFMALADVINGTFGAVVRWVFPVTLILARQHYTSDVLVAMAIFHGV